MLYGSQTGNAESLATDLSERLNERGVSNQCMNLNEAKTLSLKDSRSLLIILCSTTGNGDAPENADSWWRSVKLRSAVSNVLLYRSVCVSNYSLHMLQDTTMFRGVSYSILGLGDTNYDKFCYMGKAIDKRLGELGGQRALAPYFADEGTGMEEMVEAWKAAVFDLAVQFASCT